MAEQTVSLGVGTKLNVSGFERATWPNKNFEVDAALSVRSTPDVAVRLARVVLDFGFNPARLRVEVSHGDLSDAYEAGGLLTFRHGSTEFAFPVGGRAGARDSATPYDYTLAADERTAAFAFFNALPSDADGATLTIADEQNIPEDFAVDATAASWAYAAPEPSATLRDTTHEISAGAASWAYSATQPTVYHRGLKAVDARAAAWSYSVPPPTVAHAVHHAVDAVPAAWEYAAPAGAVSRATNHAADAGAANWSYDARFDESGDKSRLFTTLVRHRETGLVASLVLQVEADPTPGLDGRDGSSREHVFAATATDEDLAAGQVPLDSWPFDAPKDPNAQTAADYVDRDGLRWHDGWPDTADENRPWLRHYVRAYKGPEPAAGEHPARVAYDAAPGPNEFAAKPWEAQAPVRVVGADGDVGKARSGIGRTYLATLAASAATVDGRVAAHDGSAFLATVDEGAAAAVSSIRLGMSAGSAAGTLERRRYFPQVEVGDTISLYEVGDAGNWADYRVTAVPTLTDASRTAAFAVAHVESGLGVDIQGACAVGFSRAPSGSDGVDAQGRESIYTAKADDGAITGAANLPLQSQNFDVHALRTAGGLVRGSQAYYDGTPEDLGPAKPFVIEFTRKVVGDPAQNEDIGNVPWTQHRAVRLWTIEQRRLRLYVDPKTATTLTVGSPRPEEAPTSITLILKTGTGFRTTVGNPVTLTSVPTTGISHEFTGLSANTRYRVEGYATYGKGGGAVNGPTDYHITATAGGVGGQQAVGTSESSIRATVPVPEGENPSYEWEYDVGIAPGQTEQLWVPAGVTATNVVSITGLGDNASFTVRCRITTGPNGARVRGGWFIVGSAQTFQRDGAPSVARNLAISLNANGSFNLSWDEPATSTFPIWRYGVRLWKDGVLMERLGMSNTTRTRTTHIQTLAGNYSFDVTPISGSESDAYRGDRVFSTTVAFGGQDTAGVDDSPFTTA